MVNDSVSPIGANEDSEPSISQSSEESIVEVVHFGYTSTPLEEYLNTPARPVRGIQFDFCAERSHQLPPQR